MTRLKSWLASCMLLVFLATRTSIAYAEDAGDGEYSEIKKDEPAPYDGFIFDKDGFAKLITNQEFKLKQLKLDLETEAKKAKIESEADLKKKELEVKINKEMYEALLKSKDNRIEALQTEINWGTAKLVGGFVVGLTVSITIFYAAVQVAK